MIRHVRRHDRDRERADEVRKAEQRAAEATLRARLLERMLDASTQGVVLLDASTRVLGANAGARELLSRRSPDATAAAGSLELPALALRARRAAAPVDEERDVFLPARRRLRLRAVPMEDGCVVLIDDVTEATIAASVRRDFVANVSHELKTPLAGMALLAGELAHAIATDPEVARRFAERIGVESERLARLVVDLLDLSRIESDLPLETTDKDAVAILRESVERVATLAEAKGIRIEVAPAPPATLAGDAAAVAAALSNLLDNAVRYSGPGAVVRATVIDRPTEISFVVEDTGIGIPTEELPRIFERFYRVDKARSRSTGGTGLGLAIVKHVAERHGGRVEAVSELGTGSRFTLTFPKAAK